MKKSKTIKQIDIEVVINNQLRKLVLKPMRQAIAKQTLAFPKLNKRIYKILKNIKTSVEILARQKYRDLEKERKSNG